MKEIFGVLTIWRDLKFLVLGPLIFGFCAIMNLLASPGELWVHWVALGLGIPWMICLFRVARAALLVGGLAALIRTLRK